MILFVSHIIGYDIWFYLSHLILHHPMFYAWHKQHHRNPHPNFLDAYDASIQETVFQALGILAPYALYDYDVYQLLMALAFISIRGGMRHEPRCISLIGNHHLIHHESFNYNYGEPWIDWIAGTDHPDPEKRKYGIIYY
jgi:hypothetical protein